MPTKAIVYTSQALEDITEILAYLAKDNQTIVQAFRKQLEQTCSLLADMSGIGTPRNFNNAHLTGVRSHPLKQFEKYLVFYQVHDESMHVIRVLHGARNLPVLLEEDTD